MLLLLALTEHHKSDKYTWLLLLYRFQAESEVLGLFSSPLGKEEENCRSSLNAVSSQ